MSNGTDMIVIRSWPKVIFLYPVMITALGCGIFQLIADPENTAGREWAGAIFFVVLCLNLLVISFEFSRFKTMSLAFFIFAVFFFFLYLSKDYAITQWFKEKLGKLDIDISTSFYFWLSGYFIVIFFFVFVTTRVQLLAHQEQRDPAQGRIPRRCSPIPVTEPSDDEGDQRRIRVHPLWCGPHRPVTGLGASVDRAPPRPSRESRREAHSGSLVEPFSGDSHRLDRRRRRVAGARGVAAASQRFRFRQSASGRGLNDEIPKYPNTQ